ncbi:Uncharacterised protein [Mycobacterium tuberculosis]|uniref:Uncharacterized protein n=2 Tax=Mycobacterium tuberculosis TaxID=1773 RepID=A0A0U0T176_MYCTX|nr:Uncharacterised protein [Mycobacterium tuberculosis]CKU89745.1 Uncharacterised protein [Mycobacterium tuberculosis]CNV43694.1 Uncharacterised protein [Mycobacterium tuberculosis]CNV64110.1 Uncharacterised protein [Mycobacterium tuberculosis]COW79675.1 Uncharacterised protein [Mycobacterium tuberculosis]
MHHAVGIRGQRGHHRDPARRNQIQHCRGVHLVDVADQADVGGHAVDGDAAPHGGEQLRVLAGDPDGIRSVRVDQVDQFPAHLTEQHHPGHVEHFGCGDPESALEVALDAEPPQHGGDLRPPAVHHDGMDAAVAQKRHVGGERAPQRVVGHRVAAVFDDDDLAVQLLEPGQGLGQHLRFDVGGQCFDAAHEL